MKETNVTMSSRDIGYDSVKEALGEWQGPFVVYVPFELAPITGEILDALNKGALGMMYQGAVFKTVSPETSWALVSDAQIFISDGTNRNI